MRERKLVGALLCALALWSAGPAAAAGGSAAFCTENHGTWDQGVCTAHGTNAHNIDVKITARYPDDLLADPAAEPVLKEFVRAFFTRFEHLDDLFVRDGFADLKYQTFTHGPDIRSVVFTNLWDLGGAHPNDEMTTFTVDLRRGKVLALADLFCVGVDPLIELPPLARPYVEKAIGPKFDIAQFEPGSKNSFADDYQAWYLDGDDLVLVMPSARSGPATAGLWQPHVPLSQLHSILRDGACAA